jgi:hypothetical protein
MPDAAQVCPSADNLGRPNHGLSSLIQTNIKRSPECQAHSALILVSRFRFGLFGIGCVSKGRTRLLLVTGLLRVAAEDLDFIGHHRLATVFHLKCDVLDNEGPHLVTEAICVERALYISASQCPLSATLSFGKRTCARLSPQVGLIMFTLNCNLALTLSFSVSATALSKLARIFMAS